VISFRCPCGHGWTANPEGGRKAACPKCGRSVLAQAAGAKPAARPLQAPRTPPPMLPPPALPPVPRRLRGPAAKTFAILLVVVGLFPLSLAIVVGTWSNSTRDRTIARRFEETGVPAKGKISSVTKQEKGKGGSEFVVWFEYTVEGQVYSDDDSWGGFSIPPKEGEELEILYDREDPSRSMTRHEIRGAPGSVPWMSLFILLLSAAFPIGAWAGWRMLQTWRRGELVECRILSKKEIGLQKQPSVLYAIEYVRGGKTWQRNVSLPKSDPARENGGKSYALVDPNDPRRVMLVPTSVWDLAKLDPRESFDRLFVWGGGALGGVCGLLGLLLLGYAISQSGGTKDVAASKPESAEGGDSPGAIAPVAATETWLCVDNTGEAPLEAHLDGESFEVAPWTLVRRPLAAGKRRLMVASAGASLFEREFEPKAGFVYLCDPLKHGSYVTWKERYYCNGGPFVRYAFGERNEEHTSAAIDWLEAPDGIPPGESVPDTAKDDRNRTVVRKRVPDPLSPALAERLLTPGGLGYNVWDGDVWEPALRACAKSGAPGMAARVFAALDATESGLRIAAATVVDDALAAIEGKPYAEARDLALAAMRHKRTRTRAFPLLARAEARGDAEVRAAVEEALSAGWPPALDRLRALAAGLLAGGDAGKAASALVADLRGLPEAAREEWMRILAASPCAASADLTPLYEAGLDDPSSRVRWYAGSVGCNRAIALLEAGDADGAQRECDRVTSKVPERPEGQWVRGMLLERKDSMKEAIAAYDKALDLGPCVQAWHSRGVARFAIGDLSGAWTDLEAVLQAQTAEDKYVYLLMWVVLVHSAGPDSARERFMQMFDLPSGKEWADTLIRFVSGSVGEEELLRLAEDPDAQKSKERRCEASFYAAQPHLAKRDIPAARRLLEAAVATQMTGFVEWNLARRQLAALEGK